MWRKVVGEVVGHDRLLGPWGRTGWALATTAPTEGVHVEGAGVVVVFAGGTVIGTAADCDIVVYDPYLSARHAIIMVESRQSKYVIQDLDSLNGTYINRQRVAKHDLIDNDEIRFGQAEFRFKALY